MIKDLQELVNANVISEEVAADIQAYYSSKHKSPRNKLFIAFAILGALLIGLGIILIIAHNWDDLSKTTKTIIAFLPLLIGQALSGYALFRRNDSTAWREAASAFLFCAVGASISLISQIYNIPGDEATFLRTWMLLCLPLIYLMRSSSTSLMYLAGITYYACEAGYWGFPSSEPYLYWLMLLLALPHYYLLLKNKPESNFTIFHHWMVPLSIVICLGILADETAELLFIAYIALLGLFHLIGSLPFFSNQKIRNNGYEVIGTLGTIIILLILSFEWFWKDLVTKPIGFTNIEGLTALLLTLAAAALLYFKRREVPTPKITMFDITFILFPIFFLIGMKEHITATILVNVLLLLIGLFTIKRGADLDHLGVLNFGLLTVAVLAACRFFDTNISFVIRGIMFVLVGIGFFAANFWMLKRRKEDE